MKTFSGNLIGDNLKIAIIISRFNEFISGKLLEGANDCLLRHKVDDDKIDVFWTPGAFEIPSVAQKVASSGNYNAIICLGAVIRGETPHFEYVSAEVSKGIANVSLDTQIPVIFGVLTADTTEQAIDRAGTKSGNKGWSAALAAIEMANLYKEI